MAASFEMPTQYERDLRSVNKEWKRVKDSTEKWSRGGWPSPGVRIDHISGELITGSESQKAKIRPRSRYCDNSHTPKRTQNLVKMRANYDVPWGQMRTKLHAKHEIVDAASRSVGDLPPLTSPLVRRASATDSGVLYSFDRTDTPGRPLTLDIFVKTTGRDTERLVEKEYEVVDANGEALKGRKARRNLRHAATDGVVADTVEEVDGFELV